MNIYNLILGIFTFLIIGLFHPIVIKAEYYFGTKVWPVFAVLGIGFIIAAISIESLFIGGLLSVTGFSCLWSILELFDQEKRVEKGWFPANPNKIKKENIEDKAYEK
ncbi:MAG: DUF4491 family protein [Tissierellia bacterium]|nr:DUF4491 family protein [Tissierellia bacterium]